MLTKNVHSALRIYVETIVYQVMWNHKLNPKDKGKTGKHAVEDTSMVNEMKNNDQS